MKILYKGILSYVPLKAEIVNAIVDDVSIKVAVLLEATSLSTPALSQMGMSIGPPPIPRVAPRIPAQSPAAIYLLILAVVKETSWIDS